MDHGRLPAARDNTDFQEFQSPWNNTDPLWYSLDVENGWIFTALHQGLEIWDARGPKAAAPIRANSIGQSKFPIWTTSPHELYPVRDVDAPPGNDRVVAVAIRTGGGLAVFDTSTPGFPRSVYGDGGKNGSEVYAGRIAGSDYAFLASLDGFGLLSYNLTAAAALSSPCVDATPVQQACGVYVGRLGSSSSFKHVDGAGDLTGNRHWIVASHGSTNKGFEIWEVSHPHSPQLLLRDLTDTEVLGVALWRAGSEYFLGLRARVGGSTFPRIYDVSCIASGGCGPLGQPIWSTVLPAGASEFFVTYSESDNRRFLYFGSVDRCFLGLQREWLFDVTNPEQTFDVTPPSQIYQGQLTGYWGWYYRRNPTGFNRIAPRVGKFAGPYFYRAAESIFDIHRLTDAPGDLFIDGFESGSLSAWSATVP